MSAGVLAGPGSECRRGQRLDYVSLTCARIALWIDSVEEIVLKSPALADIQAKIAQFVDSSVDFLGSLCPIDCAAFAARVAKSAGWSWFTSDSGP